MTGKSQKKSGSAEAHFVHRTEQVDPFGAHFLAAKPLSQSFAFLKHPAIAGLKKGTLRHIFHKKTLPAFLIILAQNTQQGFIGAA